MFMRTIPVTIRGSAGLPQIARFLRSSYQPQPAGLLRLRKATRLKPLPAPVWGKRNFSTTVRRRDKDEDDEMGKEKKIELKTPKGTKDYWGPEMILREEIKTKISDVFKSFGGVTIDTPDFELKEILTGKYGEDSKLIYDLADQGGELCSLRYDMTVPFARFLAMNRDIQSMRRFVIGKVWRRDQPAMTKGRMREFYQCDIDIAGTYDSMIPDAEILSCACQVFDKLGWTGKYTIKINHRKILDGIFEVCGVPTNKIRTISSAVDKLDKLPWEEVRKEMTVEKGLPEEVADQIGQYVNQKGQLDLLNRLQADEELMANPSMKAGCADMELLFRYLKGYQILENVSFDLSLARGLDYYTGVIYEIVTEGSAPATLAPTSTAAAEPPKPSKKRSGGKSTADADEDRSADPSVGVGSVAAGGRYDNLVGMFSGKNQIPCVGISFGLERIFAIELAKRKAENRTQIRANETDVFVMAFGGKGFTGLIDERISICTTLRRAGIKTEFSLKQKPKLPQQFKAAEQDGIPLAIIFGEDEIAQGKVKIKEMGLPQGHPEKEGVDVDLKNIVPEIQKRLKRMKALEGSAPEGQGLQVVYGIKHDEEKSSIVVPQTEKPAGEGEKAEAATSS